MKRLRLARDLILPLDFATEGVAVTGMRGSGKSNSEARWCEVLYAAGIPFVTVDPKGDWGGIRSSADGKQPGLAVPVFGGLNGDFPLEEHLGERIADVLVDKNLSAVLDVSRLTKGARSRFLIDFFNRLIDRHQREPHVRCVVLEEAHRYIPQVIPDKTAAQLKEAAAAILLEGRAWGLGCWAATQRPARLHKDVLEEVGTAIVHRIGVAATNDLRTIAGWVKHEELSDEIVPTLTKLANGEGWVLAPSTIGVARLVQFDRRTTFDSAATPLVGAAARRSVTMADIDAGAIKEALADAIERAEQDDPAVLRKEITRLRKQLADVKPQVVEQVVTETVEVVPSWLRESLVGFAHELDAALLSLENGMASLLQTIVTRLDAEVATARSPKKTETKLPSSDTYEPIGPPGKLTLVAGPQGGVEVQMNTRRSGGVSEGGRKILAVLHRNRAGLTRHRLAALAGFSPRKSTLRGVLADLRAQGLITPGGVEMIQATDAGIDLIGSDLPPIPTGPALLEWWKEQVGPAQAQVLDVIVNAYPRELSREQVADATGHDAGKSTLRGLLAPLRAQGLIEGLRATDEFMDAIT